MDIRDSINMYSQEELSLLITKCLELHYEKGLGIPIQKKLHSLLHREIGKLVIDNGEFDNFKQRYLAGEFDETMQK